MGFRVFFSSFVSDLLNSSFSPATNHDVGTLESARNYISMCSLSRKIYWAQCTSKINEMMQIEQYVLVHYSIGWYFCAKGN